MVVPPRFGQPFKPGGDVHAITVHRAVGLFDDVAQVHADTKSHAVVGGRGVSQRIDLGMDGQRG